MKNIVIVVFSLFSFSLFGQKYYVEYHKNNEQVGIEIEIDTSWSSTGIFVQKSFSNDMNGKILVEQHALVLIGNMPVINDKIKLDYSCYNYHWIPFDPEVPFYDLNRSISSDILSGTLYLGNNYSKPVNPGDVTYWCSCGGHSPDTETPEGCVSALSENRVVSCVKDGDCMSVCIGTVVEHQRSVQGGGILIQVSKSKAQFVHNFATQ